MSDAALSIRDLTVKGRGESTLILDGISFDIRHGEVTGIVGESGSGKSVTALSIMKLLPPALTVAGGSILFRSGDVEKDILTLDGHDINGLRGRHISMIFQEPMTSLNPSMRCGNQVDEALRMHTVLNDAARRDRIMELFNQVKLPRVNDMYDSYPHQLSGGQRQRIMIAMALAAGPGILIADEPTTALDVTVQKKIVDLIRELQERTGITVIFISHDLRLIGEIAQEIIVMRKGRLVEKNRAKTLLSGPVRAYTQGLLACQPPLGERPERLLTVEDFEKGETAIPASDLCREQKPAGDKNEIILSVKNLSVHYKRSLNLFGTSHETIKAVDNVSLEVRKGETLGLVGESGCGKTTLGMTLLQLIRHQDGDIMYRGKPVAAMKGHELKTFRQRVQVVFQDPYSSLNPRMTVGSMIAEVMKVHFPSMTRPQRNARITELLLDAGLPANAAVKYPHEFSGGQRQRIGIARALATRPEFLILDESVSALDVSVQAQILNLLNDLKRNFGLSYIFISHDLAVVKYMSDRIIVMKDGHIEEEGNADRIYNDPSSEYTRNLIRAVPGNH